MTIRRLLPSDASDFQALRLRGLREVPTAFSSSYEEECDRSVDAIAERISANPDGAIFGAFDDRVLVGVIGLQREKHTKLAHKAVIWGLYVAPEFRKQGIARLLVDEALKFAFAMPGVRQVNLGVNAANAPAIALYQAAGFRPFGIERGCMIVDGVLEDEIHMVYVREEG